MADGGQSNALRNITCGSVAGMAAKVFEHPFDLVKVRLQSQPTDRPVAFTGPLDCFRQTYLKEGWRGFYRGLSAPLVGAAIENATLFLVYNKCQDLIRFYDPDEGAPGGLSEKARGKRRDLGTPELALAAAGAGAAASFILTPIELIKCRMQVQMLAREGAFGPAPTRQPLTPFSTISPVPNPRSIVPPRAVGPIAMLLSTLRTSGLRGLWLGQMGTLLRETGGSSAWFTAYEVSSAHLLARRRRLTHDPHLTKQDLRTYELMLSGALAGMSYNLVLFPADSVKSAMQTWAELNPSLPRLGFLQMSTRIWRTRGLRGMYAGCGLTVARSAPSSAMIFVIYETMETRLAGWSGR